MSPMSDFSRIYLLTSIGTPLIIAFRCLRQATALIRRFFYMLDEVLELRHLFSAGPRTLDVLEVLDVYVTLDRRYLGGSK